MAGIHKRWLMLAVLFLARTAVAFQFQTVASVRPFLMDALAIDFAAFGLLIGLYLLPGVVIALPSGMLGQRFGAKQIMLVGLALMAVGGVLMGLASSFAVVAAGRLVAGIGAVFINVLGAKMIADWFVGREIVTAMAISIASWPFGLAVGLVLFGPLAESVGWSAVMHLGALSALAALLIVLMIYRDPGAVGRRHGAFRVEPDAARMAAGPHRGRDLGSVQRRLHRADQLRARAVHRARLYAARSQPHRQPDRLGADPVRSAGGIFHRADRAAEPHHGRGARDHLRGPGRAAVGRCAARRIRGRRAGDRRAGRHDRGAARAGAARGIARRRNGRVLHRLLRRDGGPARRGGPHARHLGQPCDAGPVRGRDGAGVLARPRAVSCRRDECRIRGNT